MQNHVPVLKIIHNNTAVITIEVHNMAGNLSLHVTYTTQTRVNFTDIAPKIYLNRFTESDLKQPYSLSTRIDDLKENDWIIFNLQQIGKC